MGIQYLFMPVILCWLHFLPVAEKKIYCTATAIRRKAKRLHDQHQLELEKNEKKL